MFKHKMLIKHNVHILRQKPIKKANKTYLADLLEKVLLLLQSSLKYFRE